MSDPLSPLPAQERALARNVRARIEATAPSFGPGDSKVARLVLEQPDTVIYNSVSETAEAAGTSTATVIRFAQKLGLRGFQELKLALANDLPTADDAVGDERSLIKRVVDSATQSVRDVEALVDPEAFESAVEMVSQAHRVLWVAMGASATIAQEGAYLGRMVGIDSEAPSDFHVSHLASRQLRSDDVCIAVSQSGVMRETLTLVEAAKRAGAGTIAITSYITSPLTQVVDVVLTAGSREISQVPDGMERRLGLHVVVHALLAAVARHNPERSQLAHEIVSDVMNEHML